MTALILTVAHPSLVAPLHIRGPWTTVGTLCRGSGRHCHHPLRRQLPLIIVGGFRSGRQPVLDDLN